jgi:hypothetical protein
MVCCLLFVYFGYAHVLVAFFAKNDYCEEFQVDPRTEEFFYPIRITPNSENYEDYSVSPTSSGSGELSFTIFDVITEDYITAAITGCEGFMTVFLSSSCFKFVFNISGRSQDSKHDNADLFWTHQK